MLTIDPWCFYYSALLVLLVPLPWLLAAIAAAAVHELCHIAAILLMGETIQQVILRPWGMVIKTSFSGREQELIASLAGPAGSFSLLLVRHICPRLAVCGFFQGLFNLIPLYPMDGGRALKCVLALILRKIPCKGRRNRVQ